MFKKKSAFVLDKRDCAKEGVQYKHSFLSLMQYILKKKQNKKKNSNSHNCTSKENKKNQLF